MQQLLQRSNSSSHSSTTFSGFLLKRSKEPVNEDNIRNDDNTDDYYNGSHETSLQVALAPPRDEQDSTARLCPQDPRRAAAVSNYSDDNDMNNNNGQSKPDLTDAFARMMLGVDMEALQQPARQQTPEPATAAVSPTEATPPGTATVPGSNRLPFVPNIVASATRSKPIKFGSAATSSEDGRVSSSVKSAISAAFSSTSPQQHTFSDYRGNDGHMWRSKYCVLEQGVLYFYKNQQHANSEDAKLQREQDNRTDEAASGTPLAHAPPAMNLAHSPMPNRLMASLYPRQQQQQQPASNAESPAMTHRIWEKRVHLDLVGVVRSAEVEFGPNVFELLAVDEHDSDRLVLKAPPGEMKEWLFNFHLSMAMYVRRLVEELGNHPTTDRIIQHYESRVISIASTSSSPVYRSGTVLPQTLPQEQPTALSHGHGRTSHRRRVDREQTTESHSNSSNETASQDDIQHDQQQQPLSPTSSPESPVFPFQLSHDEPHNVSSAAVVTPLTVERPITETLIPSVAASSTPGGLPSSSSQSAASNKKYQPRFTRNGGTGKFTSPIKRTGMRLSLEERIKRQEAAGVKQPPVETSQPSTPEIQSESESDDEQIGVAETILGGCADPNNISGSILDTAFIPFKASRVGKSQTRSFGCRNSAATGTSSLRWELGSVSECGRREFNEDSFMVSTDLPEAWGSLDKQNQGSSLFAIFDGHAGNHAARYAAENLPQYLKRSSKLVNQHQEGTEEEKGETVRETLERAMVELDAEFCRLCSRDGRDWFSGTTALVAVVVDELLVVANLGDSRGVMGCSIKETSNKTVERDGWHALPPGDYSGSGQCLWKEMSKDHVPARTEEQVRIVACNGWITKETEIPTGMYRRLVTDDEYVVDILRRCLVDRAPIDSEGRAKGPHNAIDISRVCGELQVTRAIGDRDFKAVFNTPQNDGETGSVSDSNDAPWECPLLLPYPAQHSKKFVGDIISSVPECRSLKLGHQEVCDEFLVMGCDGLWDVMNGDDAIRIGRDLLFEKSLTARQTASRLAKLAIHLGSSDNITVIVVRFFQE